MIFGRHKRDFEEIKQQRDERERQVAILSKENASLADAKKSLEDELYHRRSDTVMQAARPQSLLDELRSRRDALWNEIEQQKNVLVELDAEIYWLETNKGAEKIIEMVIDHRNRGNQVPRANREPRSHWRELGEEARKKLKEFNAAD